MSYCHNCSSFICKHCREISHNTHKVESAEAASDKKKMLLTKLDPLENTVNRLSLTLQKVVANKNEVEDQGKITAQTVFMSCTKCLKDVSNKCC